MTSIKRTSKKKCIRCLPCQETKNADCHYKHGINMEKMNDKRNLYRKNEKDWKAIERKKNEDEYTETDIKNLLEAIKNRKEFNKTYIKEQCRKCDYGYKDHLEAVRWLENKLISIRRKHTLTDFIKKSIKSHTRPYNWSETKQSRATILKRAKKIIKRTLRNKITRTRIKKRRNSATKKIQRTIRGKLARNTLKTLRTRRRNSATKKIQTTVRGKLARNTLKTLRTKQKRRIDSATKKIQRTIKTNYETLKTNFIVRNKKRLKIRLKYLQRYDEIINDNVYNVRQLIKTLKDKKSYIQKNKNEWLDNFKNYLRKLLTELINIDNIIQKINKYIEKNEYKSYNDFDKEIQNIIDKAKPTLVEYDPIYKKFVKETASIKKRADKYYDSKAQEERSSQKARHTSNKSKTKDTLKRCMCKNKKKCCCGFKKNKKKKKRKGRQ